jgi:hypothetical protein
MMRRSGRLCPGADVNYDGFDRKDPPQAVRMPVMNRYERGGGEAVVEYLDSNLKVIRPGSYVRCAVTGQAIPLDAVRYWSVERQEAYVSPAAVLERLGRRPKARG